MQTVIIEFYDSGVRISDGETIVIDSTSCALIDSDGLILIGDKAEQQAHLRPRECCRNFWSQLSKNSDTKYVISNTEIALHHLKYLWNSCENKDSNVILITPTTLDKKDLGLLLGICNKLPINVNGIVANATLAMQHPISECESIYLDVQQQQIAITEIIQSDTGVSLHLPSQLLNFGLVNFIQNIASNISNKFISETRFDPLHTAKDEQQFFNKLPSWLSELNDNETIECKLISDEKYYSVSIEKEDLHNTNNNLFAEIANYLNILFHSHNNLVIYCSSSCNQVFGLNNFLSMLPGCAVSLLDDVSLTKQASQLSKEIISDKQVHYINSLPWKNKNIPTLLDFNPGKLSNISSTPTHILIDGYAHSLKQNIFIDNNNSKNLKITTEKTSNSLCKILTNNLSVEIHVFGEQSIILNNDKLEDITIARIGDCLNVNHDLTNYIFIKVIENEA